MTRLLSYLVVFVLGFGLCAAILHWMAPSPSAPPTAITSPVTYRPAAAGPPVGGRYTVADAVARVEPTVVDIHTLGKVVARDPESGSEEGWLRHFFGSPRLRHETAPVGVASGVLISGDGYIVTNNHVVADADRIRVTLPDQRRFEGTVVGSDADSDLAVVKISGRSLPAVRLGDSSRLRKGEWVVAIGNPLELDSTATVGVVSATRRAPFWVEGKRLHNVIQTDAAINQGNSGGALINLDGELIGINTAILSSPLSGGSIGIGFAIPINDVRPIVAQLIRHGRVVRPWIGIGYAPAPDSEDLWGDTESGGRRGVVVNQVFQNSPASSAGLRNGDIIRRLGTTPINGTEDVFDFIGRHTPGDAIPVVVFRSGQRKQFRLRLSQKPDAAELNATPRQP